MSERWLPIPGFEGRYEVSDMGRVRSLDRVVVDSRGVPFNRKGRLLKGGISGQSGYPSVSLGKACTKYTHLLVLAAFVGPRPPEMECRHLNGNRSDSRLVNLAWGTRAENANDKVAHGTTNVGERNPQSRLTDADVRAMRAARQGGALIRELAEQFHVSAMTVQRAVTFAAWRHL